MIAADTLRYTIINAADYAGLFGNEKPANKINESKFFIVIF